jgi:hypothetical protein
VPDQLLDQRNAATAAGTGAAGVAHVLGCPSALSDCAADRSIRDPIALTDQHSALLGRPEYASAKMKIKVIFNEKGQNFRLLSARERR